MLLYQPVSLVSPKHLFIRQETYLCLGAFALVAMLIAPPSHANQHDTSGNHGDHGHHEELIQPSADDSAVAAYQAANDQMHENMAMSFTGDPDVDFARGMIPHHEGAIAMAEIVLEYGEDEEIRQLAEDVIAAQESEIAFLEAWLEKYEQ